MIDDQGRCGSRYSELSNKRTAGNNRTADPEVMKLIIGPQVLIGPKDQILDFQ